LTFTCFPKLPIDIRLEIRRATFPGGREIAAIQIKRMSPIKGFPFFINANLNNWEVWWMVPSMAAQSSQFSTTIYRLHIIGFWPEDGLFKKRTISLPVCEPSSICET
jgi:hypothetical protein